MNNAVLNFLLMDEPVGGINLNVVGQIVNNLADKLLPKEAILYTPDFGEDEYLFNSSSSSDSEDDGDCTCSDPQPSKKLKLEGYVEIEVPKLNQYDFRHNFRIARGTFEKVLEMLHNSFYSDHKGGRERVTPEKAAYILLWYLGNQETFKQMSDRFQKTMSCIHNIVKFGTLTLSAQMYEQVMWPSAEEYPSISKMFQDVCHLKKCIGVLGVSYMKIPKPKEIDSVNRCHNVTFQGAVTINGKFMDTYITEGTINPELTLGMSSLPQEAEKDLFGEYYLIGFNNYVNRSWLIQPFNKDCTLTPPQQFFNKCHEAAANIFPQALGILKGRFQRLQHFENRDVPFVVKCIEAACTLHNLAIDCDEDSSDFAFSDDGIIESEPTDYGQSNNDETRTRIFRDLVSTMDAEHG